MDRTISLLAQPSPSRTFESEAKSLIEAAEANIARIESQIRDLVRLRDRERGIIARLRLVIAPIHKLPAELLVEIFQLAKTGHYTWNRKDTINKIHALSQVCAYWRQLAHTTPQLWTENFQVVLKKTLTDEYLASAKGWLERSAPLPIPISLLHLGGSDPKPFMDVLVGAARRWKSVNFNLESLAALSRIPSDALTSIETLTLCSTDGLNYGTAIGAFLHAPRLRHLHLVTRQITILPMPWSQLTEITVTNPYPQTCLDALMKCTNIVSAKFDTHAWSQLPDLSQQEITTLARLERLDLRFPEWAHSRHFMSFFERLTLPALKTLSLDLNLDLVWNMLEFTQFQQRSPNIESLSIETSGIVSTDLLTLLRYAPSLIELNMTYCLYCIDDFTVAALEYSETDVVHLAPRLEILVLSEVGKDFEDDVLDATIKSRWWTDEQLLALPSPPRVARWSKIDICCDDGSGEDVSFSPELEARLDEYQSQGLDINLS
ncbi:hypothetical protein C8R44DRAFT_822657 [Mycena epipterygia]|nr:hypothetical protein C8R44DRAFT_822657 [Mycena epipterygia]